MFSGAGDDDVVADGERVRAACSRPAVAAHRAIGEHVVEQHGVDAAEQPDPNTDARRRRTTPAVMPCVALGVEQQVVGDRAAERGDALPLQIGERAIAVAIAVAHGEHFAELVVRNAGGQRLRAAPAMSSMPLRPMSKSPRFAD